MISGVPEEYRWRRPRSSLQKAVGIESLRSIELQSGQDSRLLRIRPGHATVAAVASLESLTSVALDRAGHTALTGRIWQLPRALPDDPSLVDLWIKLATQRTFTSGDNVEWLDPDALNSLAAEFQDRTGMSWAEWSDATRAPSDRTADAESLPTD